MRAGAGGARLLPWAGEDGKPCYLLTDGDGPLARAADAVEAVQLSMAVGLLRHADGLLADERASSVQLRYLLARMCESLRDVHRVAESRGARLDGTGRD
ncbi:MULTISPECIES: hypothetical protein [Streptomyces]|jgi:hypothetical protein|uniref:hypothetical protein n=1 Tax=Streptomyces TaxID=1883 RepID=UPI0036B30A8D